MRGPTPPGTGEMKAARAAASGAVSPTTLPFSRLVPTSMIIAPGLTSSLVKKPAFPTATTMRSADCAWGLRVAERGEILLPTSPASFINSINGSAKTVLFEMIKACLLVSGRWVA